MPITYLWRISDIKNEPSLLSKSILWRDFSHPSWEGCAILQNTNSQIDFLVACSSKRGSCVFSSGRSAFCQCNSLNHSEVWEVGRGTLPSQTMMASHASKALFNVPVYLPLLIILIHSHSQYLDPFTTHSLSGWINVLLEWVPKHQPFNSAAHLTTQTICNGSY